jgi:myo-inositol-1(or 4)-monophosphatase
MIGAARKAGRRLARDFGEVEHLQVSKKGPADFVSAADRRAEDIIFKELSEARPGYGFLMEERGEVEGTDKSHRWIVDPLDGTTNFLHAVPHFAVSIALEREGVLHAGIVYDVAKDEMFWGERNKGAYVGDRRLRVSARAQFETSLIATGLPFLGKPGHARLLKELFEVMPACAGVRRYGAASLDLAWVAAGRYDGFWERGLAPWDTAAGAVLIREAAGLTADIDSDDADPVFTGNIVCGNEVILPKLRERLQKAGA